MADGTLKYVLTLDSTQGIAALQRFNAVAGLADRQLGAMAGSGRGSAGAIEALQGSLATALPVVTAVSAALTVLTAGFSALGKGMKLAATAEQTAIAFKTLTGNAQEALNVLSMLSNMAIETPFEEAELQGAARTLLAARVPAVSLKQELLALGNIAAATGANIGSLAVVFAQVAGKGRLYTEELQQFVEQGFGELKPALAETLGATMAELEALLQAGQVGFSDFEATLQRLASSTGKWGRSMAEQSQSNLGLISSLTDNVNKMLLLLAKPISDGPVKTWLTTAVNVSQQAAQIMAAAIAKGQVKEAIGNALILGAQMGVNGFISIIKNLGTTIASWAEQTVGLIQGIMSGSTEAASQAAVAIASFDWDKGLFDTTAGENWFKNLVVSAGAAGEAIKQPVKDWQLLMDNTGPGAAGGGKASPNPYTDPNMALPTLPGSQAEAQAALNSLPPEMKGLPGLPTSAIAAKRMLQIPLPSMPAVTETESPANPAAAVTEAVAPTVTASSAATPAVPAGPTATVTGAIVRGASVAAAAAKEPAKMRGYSFRAQGGADAARSRADLARYQRQDHLYSPQAVFPGRPGAAADAVQTAVGGGQGGDSTAATAKPDTSGQVAAKLDEIKAELVRIRTE